MPARKRNAKASCGECGDADIAGSFDGQAYCAECLRPLATRVSHTAEEFVSIAEDLVAIAESYDDGAAATPVRVANEHVDLMEDMIGAVKQISYEALNEQLKSNRARLPLGDDLLSSSLQDVLDEDEWGMGTWFGEPMALHVFSVAVDHQDDSVYQLLSRLFSPKALKDVMNVALRHALLGQRIELQDLRRNPHRDRLQALSGLLFAYGLVRLAHLYGSVETGEPPGEPYTAAERDLYRRLVPETVRRTQRSYFMLSWRAETLATWNDRAEQLAALWLLHPVTPRLRRYMSMLHQAYMDGRDPEAAILCRAILERAISDTCASLGLTGDDRMNPRISALERQPGVLSKDTAMKARAVWHRGNKVVHQDPDFVEDSFETLGYLLAVLDELRVYLAPPVHPATQSPSTDA